MTKRLNAAKLMMLAKQRQEIGVSITSNSGQSTSFDLNELTGEISIGSECFPISEIKIVRDFLNAMYPQRLDNKKQGVKRQKKKKISTKETSEDSES